MPSDRQSTRPGSNDASTPDGFDEIVTGYVDRLNDGEDLNPFEILAAHPEYGSEILRRLETYATLESDHNDPLGTLGDYTLRRQIGRGGMGVTCEVFRYVK